MPTKNYPAPDPAEVTALRLKLGLTQAEAAHVVKTSPLNWPRWEKQGGMPAGLWELFTLVGPNYKRTPDELVALETMDKRHLPKAPYSRGAKEQAK